MRQKVAFIYDPDCFDRHCGSDGVSPAGKSVPKHPDTAALFGNRFEDLVIDQQSRNRQVGGRSCLDSTIMSGSIP